MRISIALLVMFMLGSLLAAQPKNNRQKAAITARAGMEEIAHGNLEAGAVLLERAVRLDPKQPEYAVQAGQARFQLGEYAAAGSLIKPWLFNPNADPRVFQLYGNCMDLQDHPDSAALYYQLGIDRFPRAGILYMEYGIVLQQEGAIAAAQELWEAGIEKQPEFSGNYYWATKSLAQRKDRLWALQYGELFLNLERGTERTNEISQLLYQTYLDAIQWDADSNLVIAFSEQQHQETIPRLREFGKRVDREFSYCVLPTRGAMSLHKLHQARFLFISRWYGGYHRAYPNALFHWLSVLQKKGKMEAYDYWLFFDGNPEEFAQWEAQYANQYQEFEDWFAWHKFPISKRNRLYRGQYAKKRIFFFR